MLQFNDVQCQGSQASERLHLEYKEGVTLIKKSDQTKVCLVTPNSSEHTPKILLHWESFLFCVWHLNITVTKTWKFNLNYHKIFKLMIREFYVLIIILQKLLSSCIIQFTSLCMAGWYILIYSTWYWLDNEAARFHQEMCGWYC